MNKINNGDNMTDSAKKAPQAICVTVGVHLKKEKHERNYLSKL